MKFGNKWQEYGLLKKGEVFSGKKSDLRGFSKIFSVFRVFSHFMAVFHYVFLILV